MTDYDRGLIKDLAAWVEYGDDDDYLLSEILNLIYRLETENENYSHNVRKLTEENMVMTSHNAIFKGKERQSIKEEAIKEFIDRLKKKSHLVLPPIGYHICADEWVIYECDIDDTYAEMAGDWG